jgi:arsenite-transporting ATPase
MTRLLLFSGKGGVGKTTLAAATGLTAAERGSRTLILSFDLVHGLADLFAPERGLFERGFSQPRRVAENLDLQEIDLWEEIDRNGSAVHGALGALLARAEIPELVAKELATLPGMEVLIALLAVNRYLTEKSYDLVILDGPPTSGALRFASLMSTIVWYRSRYTVNREKLKNLAMPPLSGAAAFGRAEGLPWQALEELLDRLEGIEERLRDPQITSVRLVSSEEAVAVREMQRAHLYLSLAGLVADQVLINRRSPSPQNPLAEITALFAPLPVLAVPLGTEPVVGIAHLRELGKALYGATDPARPAFAGRPCLSISREDGGFALAIRLPFVDKREIDLTRRNEELLVRFGSFHRHIALPPALAEMQVKGARMEKGDLVVRFLPREGGRR